MNRGFLLPFLTKLRFLLGKLSESLQITLNLAPAPENCCVLRLAQPPKDFAEKGNILAIQLDTEFELSSKDKESVPPHLSVWAEFLTTPEQAYTFLQENAPNSPRKLILSLKVYEILKLVGSSGDGRTHPDLLNVIWVHLFRKLDGKMVRDCRPGAEGHCGITGLDEKSAPDGLTKAQAKLLRKDLRSKLAEIASKNYRLLNN